MFVSMLRGMSHREKAHTAACPLVAVAIDRDKSSQSALKWTLDNVVTRGQTLTLIHVNTKPSCKLPYPCSSREALCKHDPCMIYPFRVQCKDVILEDTDVAEAIADFVTQAAIEKLEDVEAEIRSLRLQLKQTMDMYSTACKEALTAKQKAMELQRWKVEEEQRLKEARQAEEAALALAQREKARCLAAIQTAEASKRIAESEAQKRISAEMQALKESEERRKAIDSLSHTSLRYRRYTIEEIEVATEYFANERKIGEGGYGPVYRCYLDHTPVAVKVLRPEYGCLVYEYMANGSLEDRLLRRGNTPPIPWQHRFRITAEIGMCLLFLHQTKPEPLVHRDLKPANILLDRNYVSKISDVGLARLVPPSVADSVTQYRLTATAGTFCYIDPEYQQTGMLGIKSDIYSLGIMLLQVITGRPPMGLTHYVERAIETGTFVEMLDNTVPEWPVDEALSLAKLALKCAELRRRDRPDLATIILPELNRLRDFAEENMQYSLFGNSLHLSPMQSQVSTQVC
ncbi:hypothetical protein GW17_00004522 [Ensete ventricosum]|nr:hypothetical protein GW17_00004522 [Ensete ventricosum]